MPFSTDYYNIYREILNTDDYLNYIAINDKIEYATKLTEDERENLRKKYSELLDSRFLHPDCSSIDEIKVPYGKGDFTRYSYEKAEQKCIFAKELGMTLADYMLRIENDSNFIIKVNPARSSENAQEVIRRLNRRSSVQNREENLGNIDEELMVKDMKLNINQENANSTKIEELGENVNDLRVLITKLQNDIRNILQRTDTTVQPPAAREPENRALPQRPSRVQRPPLEPVHNEERKPKVFTFPRKNARPAPVPPPPVKLPEPDYSAIFNGMQKTDIYYTLLFSIFVHYDKSLLRKSIILPELTNHIVTGEELAYIYDHRLDYGFSESAIRMDPDNPIQVAVYCKYVLGNNPHSQINHNA